MKIENADEFERLVDEAEGRDFSGWDFSWIAGRWRVDPPPWDYEMRVREAMPDSGALLDMGTGGGERLAHMAPLPPHSFATEAYPPNIPLARTRLEPLGVVVVPVDDHSVLPLDNSQFDTVINRHETFVASEIARILKLNGRFITQQVGEKNNVELNEWLGGDSEDFGVTLERSLSQLTQSGLKIIDSREDFSPATFFDIGAVVFYLKAVSWQVKGFTVDGYRDSLVKIHNHIQRCGSFETTSHRFLVEALRK